MILDSLACAYKMWWCISKTIYFFHFNLTKVNITSPMKARYYAEIFCFRDKFLCCGIICWRIDLTEIPDSTKVIAFNCWLQMLFGHSWSWTTLFLEDWEKQIMESASFLRDFSEWNSSNCPPLSGYLLEELKLIHVSSNFPDTAWSFFFWPKCQAKYVLFSVIPSIRFIPIHFLPSTIIHRRDNIYSCFF